MNPRSVKKYYRSLDPLLSPPNLGRKLNLGELFKREAPLELEIGFGNGEFLNRSSLERPGHDFIGLEIAWPSVKRALRRIGEPPRENVRIICLPAAQTLYRHFPEKSVSVARALFPVPWPKEKHANKRLFSKAFMELLASRLADGGRFHMVTDDLNLARWTEKEAEGGSLPLSLSTKEGILDTKYERKWKEGGRETFYHLEGEKKSHPDIGEPESKDMRPAILENLDPETYNPKGITGDLTVIFRGLTYDPAKGEGLLNTKVVEGSFIQEFFIRIHKTPDGRHKLYPALSNSVFPTEGVQKALALAADPDRSE
ncbi:MAG: hypothetical protein LBF41_01815 [Deltaproteobacteria bacterium]|jgi:tRNA (guanine-N7-)-methyltransferase|nr:hypothetical protein [Deltaproteobacteria bacterium]